MGKSKPKSIVYEGKQCAAHVRDGAMCEGPLEEHHIFYGTANRRISEETGMVCWLCLKHHRGYGAGVHGGNTELDAELKENAQKVYMDVYKASKEDFIKKFGKSYI